MIPADSVRRPSRALPFWVSTALLPLVWVAAATGGWTLILPPLAAWWLFAVLDRLTGEDTANADPATSEADLIWYRLVTLVWAPLQFATLFGLIAWLGTSDHLATWEKIGVFAGMGVLTGTVGIVYAHELMHQRNRWERRLADLLLAMVLYGHFRSEHMLVHHIHVGTPRDAVTARYNEGFHRFFLRVLPQSLASAFRAEQAMLARKGLPWWDRANPFWRYGALQAGFLLLALLLGGWLGMALFALQAAVAIWQLELTNYVEHYGLVRKQVGEGRYEPVRPCHSWNVSPRASNRLLINLQRHADHHARPDRRYPLLQNHGPEDSPQLPYGYPVMTLIALVPPLWRRVMNPRVRQWRATFYPEVTAWAKGRPAA